MMLTLLQNTALTTAESSGIAWSTYAFWGTLLFCAALFFYMLRRTDKIIEKEKLETASHIEESVETSHKINYEDVREEAAAAIAMALFLYKVELHDKESFIITLKKVSRIYSPWNSKIYTLRQTPIRK